MKKKKTDITIYGHGKRENEKKKLQEWVRYTKARRNEGKPDK